MMGDFWINIIAWSIVIGGFALYLSMLNHEKNTVVNTRFNTTNGKLFLIRRTPANHKVLKVEPVRNFESSSRSDTGEYQIFYDNGNLYNLSKKLTAISEVELANHSMIESAKRNEFINQFLQGNRLMLKHHTIPQTDATATAGMLLDETNTFASLTREECHKIVSWLCGEF